MTPHAYARPTLGVLLLGAAAAAASQPVADWPSRAIHLVVPLGAGGNADAVARALAKGLSERLEQPVVVENRPGAAGNIGMEHVARSAADGHTLLFAVTAAAINPSLYRLRFDPQVDLAPVAQLSRVYLAVFGRKDLPAGDPASLVEYVRANPGKVSCASTGGATQLACLELQARAGAPMIQVLFKGPVQALTDLAAGQVDVLVDTPSAARPLIEARRIKAIGTSAPHDLRTPAGELRSLSTALQGFVLPGWHGVFAPAGTPAAVLKRLNHEVNQVLQDRRLVQVMQDNGLEPVGGPPDVMAERLRDDRARYRRIAQDAGITPE